MTDSTPDLPARFDFADDDPRKFQILLIGSSEDVTEAIHTLHRLNYAEVKAWSQLVPIPNSTKRMSILTRVRLARSETPQEPTVLKEATSSKS